MDSDEIALQSSTGVQTVAPTALWVKCMIEMLPPVHQQELVRRVEAFKARGIVIPTSGHTRLIAEPGEVRAK